MRLLACVVVLAACGGDDGGGGGGDGTTALEGIYTITAWTRNETGCAGEGPSVLATESSEFLLVRNSSFFGQQFIELIPCTTLAQCRIDAADDVVQVSQFGSVSEGSDSAGWTGGRVTAGGSGGTCSGTVTNTTLTSPAAMTIRIDAETRPTGDFPTDADGFCTTDDAQEAAATQPCDGLDVLQATFTEALP